MGSIPNLPVLEDDGSMLSRKFGREIANYFSGSPLNRVSFLRHDHIFLRSAFSHPSTRFLLVNELAPLVDDTKKKLAYLGYEDVKPFTGADPYEKTEDELINDFNSEETKPLILLLGIDEANKLQAPASDIFQYKEYRGRPYFAVDVTPRGSFTETAKTIAESVTEKGMSFYQNQRQMGLSPEEGELLHVYCTDGATEPF